MDSINSADMVYIRPILGEVCGPHQTKLLYYRNTHPSWTIRIKVDHHWIYNGEELHEEKHYVLQPNPTANPGAVSPLDVLMGCPIPGPTMQTFHWDVVDAVRVS